MVEPQEGPDCAFLGGEKPKKESSNLMGEVLLQELLHDGVECSCLSEVLRSGSVGKQSPAGHPLGRRVSFSGLKVSRETSY